MHDVSWCMGGQFVDQGRSNTTSVVLSLVKKGSMRRMNRRRNMKRRRSSPSPPHFGSSGVSITRASGGIRIDTNASTRGPRTIVVVIMAAMFGFLLLVSFESQGDLRAQLVAVKILSRGHTT